MNKKKDRQKYTESQTEGKVHTQKLTGHKPVPGQELRVAMRTTIIWVAFTVLANIWWCSVEVGEVDESTRVDRSLQGGF